MIALFLAYDLTPRRAEACKILQFFYNIKQDLM